MCDCRLKIQVPQTVIIGRAPAYFLNFAGWLRLGWICQVNYWQVVFCCAKTA
jgi:hypothetical protein